MNVPLSVQLLNENKVDEMCAIMKKVYATYSHQHASFQPLVCETLQLLNWVIIIAACCLCTSTSAYCQLVPTK